MVRIIKQGNHYYGLEIDSIDEDQENIERFVDQGESVLIVRQLSDVLDFGLDPDEIKMVE